MIFALIVSWLLQMFWINWGLVHCPAIFIISLEAVFNELIAVLGGMLYFQVRSCEVCALSCPAWSSLVVPCLAFSCFLFCS